VVEQVFSPSIALYLFLAGAGSGAYTMATVFDFVKRPSNNPGEGEYHNIAQGGFYLGPLIVLLGSLFLIFDLGTPQAAVLIITNPHPTLLTTGTWFIILFCLTAAASVFIRSNSGFSTPRFLGALCGALSALLAVCIMVYTGILFSSLSALPLLNTPAVVLLLIISSLSTGSAVISIYGFLNQRKKSVLYSMRSIPRMDLLLIVLEMLALLAVYLLSTNSGSAAQQITAQISANLLIFGRLAPLFWAGVVGVGLLIPAIILMLALRNVRPTMLAVSALGLLAGGLALRLCLLMAVQHIDPALFLPA
jgi:formate-dependent nitrite reductase membrane component NrfD